MAQILLGIDVDSRDVVGADDQMDRLTGSFRDLEKQAARTTSATQRADMAWRGQADAMKQAETRTQAAIAQLKRMQAQISGVYTAVTRIQNLFIAFYGSRMIGGIIRSADAWATLQARVVQATGDQELAAAVLEKLAGVAERTQQRVEGVADSWLRMAPALKDAGRTTQEAIDFTEALNAALLVSGARGSEAAAVQLQLAQAMASGVLRGDELNSIMEQGGKVARLIAAEMGVGVGQLRAMAEQGLVTGEIIDRALRGNLEALRAEAALMPQTVGSAFGFLVDALQRMVGAVNKATGATDTLALGLKNIAGWVDFLTDKFAESSSAGMVWAANLDAASRQVALSTAKNIAVAITALDELKRAQASITPLAGDSPFTLDPGTNRVGNAVSETEKLIRLERQRLEGQRERAALVQTEAVETAKVEDFTSRIAAAIDRTVVPTASVAESFGRAGGGAGKAADATEKMAANGKKIVEDARKVAEQWAGVESSISGALMSIASGQNVTGSVTGAIQSTIDAAFGEKFKQGFDDLGEKIADSLQKSLGRIGGKTGLSESAAGVGTGIGMAAIGAMNGEASQIGSGIGMAAGSAFGPKLLGFLGAGVAGPIGMILGGLAGGFLGKLFGDGGDEDKWKRVSGTAFTGTTYATSVMTDQTMNTKTDQGFAPEGRFAFQAVRQLLTNFNTELGEFVDAAGGHVQRGTNLVVDQARALKAITGAISESDIAYKGEAGKQAAADIAQKVADIMGLAATIVQEAGPALTQAQQLWRQTQERFSDENIKILNSLGLTTKKIMEKQLEIQTGLAQGFNKEMVDTLVDLGAASRRELDSWKGMELKSLADRREAALATAKEIGASVALVESAFKAERTDIVAEWRDMLKELTGEVIDAKARLAEARGINAGMLDIIVASGRATKKLIDDWLRVELSALAERRAAAMNQAREIGASANLVDLAFRTQRAGIVQQWRELLKELTGEVIDAKQVIDAEARLSEARGINAGLLDTIVESGRATEKLINDWLRVELAALGERRAAAMKQAREVGASTNLVDLAFRAQRAGIVGEWRGLLGDLVEETEKVAEVTRRDRLGFRGNALDELVRGGDRASLNQWLGVSRKLLEEQRKDAVAEAHRLGVEVGLINRLYGKKLVSLEREYAEMRYQAVIDVATRKLEFLTTRLNNLEGRRAEVLQELASRAEQALQAERTLADARADMAGGDLNPGGPMDRFRALRAQFGSAITAARGGDSDAAGRAAGLAGELLQAGRGIYASGSGYADLFRSVNAALIAAQRDIGVGRREIEKRLDAATFTEVTERSTKSLLSALGLLAVEIRGVKSEIKDQTRRQELAQQRQRVGS